VDSLGVNVVLYIGDNLGDYSEVWDKPANVKERKEILDSLSHKIGVEFIALPNPMYGTWEGALFDYDRSLSDEKKDSIRLNNIQSWEP